MGVPSRIISIIVRVCGLVLLFVGFSVALQIIHEALDLYRNPENIERVAVVIEKGSNLDKSLAPLGEYLQDTGDETETDPEANKQPESGVRLSYFVAWVVELLLLLLVARIALAAIKTGGELALYDTQNLKK